MPLNSDSTKTQVALRLRKDLIEQVDARADQLGISRNQWFENMVSWAVTDTRTNEEKLRIVNGEAGQ